MGDSSLPPKRESSTWIERQRSVTPASAFRSTWLTSSIRALRELGAVDRYLAAVPSEHHEAILGSVAGVWLPIEVAMAHYAACDALGLSFSEQVEIGRAVTTFAHRTTYSLALRLATQAGATPWSCFALQARLWDRVWKGGGVFTSELGPKEARVEIAGWPCARFEYVRRSMHGVLLGQTELFCKKAYVRDVPSFCTSTTLGYRVSWV